MATDATRRLPGCIIIGGMKCGTTSLFRYLGNHPRVAPCKQKEPAFFAKNNWRRGVEWYQRLFPDDDRIKLEASTNYTKFPNFGQVPERMAEVIPDARLVYIVRHPVDRLQSELIHNVRAGYLEYQQLSSQTFWENGIDFHIGCSKYYWQLEQYFPHFNRDQICVVSVEELSAEPVKTLNRILQFLDLPTGFFEGQVFTRFNAAARKSPKAFLRRMRTPRDLGHFKLTEAQRQFVWNACAADLEQLESFMGRPLNYTAQTAPAKSPG